jgi:hypothetical protein
MNCSKRPPWCSHLLVEDVNELGWVPSEAVCVQLGAEACSNQTQSQTDTQSQTHRHAETDGHTDTDRQSHRQTVT